MSLSHLLIIDFAALGGARLASSQTALPDGAFVVALVDVTNQSTMSGIPAERLLLHDERGREFDQPDLNAVSIGALAGSYAVDTEYDTYGPGITKRGFFIFQVAPDAQTLTLAGSSLGC